MKKYLVNISGGGIKFVGLLSAFIELIDSGITPKKVSGVSAGAIVCLLYFTGRLQEGQIISRNLDKGKTIFSKRNNPANIWGVILKLIRRKNYIGIMDNLEKNIRKVVSKNDFRNAVKNSDVDCYIHCVDEQTQKQVTFNIRQLSYEEAISAVIGSATISPIIKTRKCVIQGDQYNLIDGGHRDSSAGSYLLKENVVTDFDEVITIWSRSNPDKHNETTKTDVGNFFKRLVSVMTVFLREGSLNDEYQEIQESQRLGKTHYSIYVKMSSKGSYSITKDQILDGERIGREAVENYFLENVTR